MLEDAFKKATSRDLKQIEFLKKDGNSANFESIFELYSNLIIIQKQIRPLLPLYNQQKSSYADFKLNDYSNDIIDAKNKLSDFLYTNASNLLTDSNSKFDYRKVYNDLKYLDQINPNYKDVLQKIKEAHFKGTDFVRVSMYNDTKMVIPQRLEDELLNFNTYGLNDIWTLYHSNPVKNTKYDYGMDVSFKDISISPEQVHEKEVIKEKEIVDGWKYLKDKRGNVVKDSLGNDIKIDVIKNVRCVLYEFSQLKAVKVSGSVVFKDLNTKQVINSYPLVSEFIFEHFYADYEGDKRALDRSFQKLLGAKPVSFPSNEQMVYDAGEDLKNRLKKIIIKHKFN